MSSSIVYGQFLPNNSGRPNYGQGNPNQIPQQQEEDSGLDTTIYMYVLLDNIFEKTNMVDTAANIQFLHRDPIWRDGNEQYNTGNRGSATSPLRYRPVINTGFNTGYDQYNIYKLTTDNFRFYEQNRPLTELSFTQLANQQNLHVGAEFSRNFSDGLSVSLNYNRISQVGIYNNQATKSTNFGIGFRYKSKSDKYNAFLVFLQNANEEQNSGGLQNISDLVDNEFRASIITKLNNARTRQQERTLALVQYLKLNNAKSKTWRVYLRNDLEYKPSYFIFSDNTLNTNNDSTFYGNLNIDTRGIRRYVTVNQIRNTFFINGERIAGVQGRLGLTFDHFNITNGSTPSSRTDLTLRFDGKVPIFSGLEMNTSAKLGLLNNAGNFDVSGKIDIKVSKIAKLASGIQVFRSEQSLHTNSLIINDQIIFTNNFTPSFGTILQADLDVPTLRFQAGFAQNIVNNPVFWNKDFLPTQLTGVLSNTYFRLKQNFRIWRIHLDNQFHYQVFSNNLYPLPSYYSTHQLYYSGSAFKKVMDLNIGLDVRLVDDFEGGVYHPVYGEFVKTDTNLPFFPAANLYLIARVSSFRAIIMLENFSQRFRNDINFDAIGHPQFDSKLRFGLYWLLKD
ncbi:MAG TPA: hypothetical protein PKD51_16455 [Saprospiraceae bacterium]|nr:hypothetical protein [Saprospiraceae bacterium]